MCYRAARFTVLCSGRPPDNGCTRLIIRIMDRRAVVAGIGMIPFLIRLYYTTRFRYKTPLFQPLKYRECKTWLSVTSLIFLIGASAFLLIVAQWRLTIEILISYAGLNFASRMFTYRRALADVELALVTIPPAKRRRIAREMVDRDILDGRLS